MHAVAQGASDVASLDPGDSAITQVVQIWGSGSKVVTGPCQQAPILCQAIPNRPRRGQTLAGAPSDRLGEVGVGGHQGDGREDLRGGP
jgi:hypothetical protein